MYSLINDGIKKCLITVVLNVQNFGKCLCINVSSVAGLIEKENMLQNKWGFCSSEMLAMKCERYIHKCTTSALMIDLY